MRRSCLSLTPRHHHPLQPRLRIIATRPVVEDRNPETPPLITALAAQPELQIVDEEIRGQPMPALQKARKILHAAPARTAHDDHQSTFRSSTPRRNHRSPFFSSPRPPFCGPAQQRNLSPSSGPTPRRNPRDPYKIRDLLGLQFPAPNLSKPVTGAIQNPTPSLQNS